MKKDDVIKLSDGQIATIQLGQGTFHFTSTIGNLRKFITSVMTGIK